MSKNEPARTPAKIIASISVYVYDGGTEGEQRVYHDIPLHEYSTVLSVLEYIRIHIDASLVYRSSCRHGSCGTCGVIANDKRILACLEHVADVQELRIQPLSGLEHISQLVVSPRAMIADFPSNAATLRESEVQPSTPLEGREGQKGRKHFERLEDCIECGVCMSSCPVVQSFMGPAPLAAIEREIANRPERTAELLDAVRGERGAEGCVKNFACTKDCPSNVNPGRKIAELKKMLGE